MGKEKFQLLKAFSNSAQLEEITRQVIKTIYSTTLSSAVNAITITTDNNGEVLNLNKAQLKIIVPSGSTAPTGTSAFVLLKVNDISIGYRWQTQDNDTSIPIGAIRNVAANIESDISVVLGGVSFNSQSEYSDGTNRALLPYAGSLISGVASLTKLYFSLSGGYTLPIGTKIELRGSTL